MWKKQTILTEVLQPSHKGFEPLLPFNDTLSNILLGTWAKPCTGPPVTRPICRRHRQAQGDPEYLTKHPTPESLVVQTPTAHLNPNAFPTSPPDRKSKRLETFGKRIV